MPWLSDKWIFSHIPKTGGIAISEAMKRADPSTVKLGGEHDPLFIHGLQNDSRLRFTVIRHPLTWYRSLWFHFLGMKSEKRWRELGWWERHFLEPFSQCFDKSYPGFLRKVLSEYPLLLGDQYQFWASECSGMFRLENIGQQIPALLGVPIERANARLPQHLAPRSLLMDLLGSDGRFPGWGYDYLPEGVCE